MEECFAIKKENPNKKANILSRLCFAWMRKICYQGSIRHLEKDDLYKSQDRDESAFLTDRFTTTWEKELEHAKLHDKTPSLLRSILRAYWWEYVSYGTLIFINTVVIGCIRPFVLAALVRRFTAGGYEIGDISLYGGALILLTLAATFMNHHAHAQTSLVGMRIRIALSSLIYRKILKLSQLSLSKTAAGQVVNLLSNDVSRFDIVVIALNYIWVAPIQVVVVAYLMWTQIGYSSFVGVGAMLVLTVPLQMFLGSVTAKYRMEVAKRTDRRVGLMSEIVAGIQVIKMYAWEKSFEFLVQLSRKEEVKSLTKSSYVRALVVSFICIVERTALAVTVISYVLMGNDLQADIVFSLELFLAMLEMTLAIMFPFAISMAAESLVTIERLQDFLLMEEKETFKIHPSADKSIRLKNVDASWTPGTPTLNNWNVKIPPGSLCAVVGPVGSGKSSFLKVLLGELMTSSGIVELSGDISYASQEPWLFASNVRNNILFGQEYNKSHYREVVRVCALEKDFEQFPEGDKTAVGDRGVSLSGGQRARINLARAIYQDSDIYLLDDPLSAVDTRVGRHLFDKCIVQHLRGKTRILVTHQLQYLKKADHIIVLNKGNIEAQGTFEELSHIDFDFTRMLTAADETNEKTENVRAISRMMSTISIATTISLTPDAMLEVSGVKDSNEEVVNFKGSAFWSYVKNCGNIPLNVIVLLLMVSTQVFLTGSDYWIALWTEQENTRQIANLGNHSNPLEMPDINIGINDIFSNTTESLNSLFNDIKDQYTEHVFVNGEEYTLLRTSALMYIFSFIIVALIVVTLARSFLYFYSCMGGSKKLHSKMFHCLLEAPMRFFDTNPAGRVLNRFSKDMGAIDDQLPKALIDVIQILFILVGIMIMVILPNPYLLVILAILGTVFLKIRGWYVKSGKALKHIESIAKSPVFSYVSSSIDGLTTIRSTKNEKILMKQFDDHQDVHTSAWYLTVLCSAAFGLWLDLVCVIFVASVIFGCIILDQYTHIGGSFAGLAISNSLTLVGMLQFGMKQISQVINYLTSVERVLEYTQLEREHPLETPADKKPKDSWPSQGKVQFRNLYLTYVLSDPPVLNNLNIDIKPTEKVGIVGRTGAGKSTLIAALFRLAPLKGEILIDGIDTQTLGLKDLRKKISIIPQEPVLFSATMRYNLDPFSEFKDDRLWDALEEVELKDDINTLDFMVTEGGSNFSVGQRQLICLGRAILRNNKILILDEATANVDPKTDELIQKTIRRKFKNCTVLTIAHRLNTIMDSDKVLVMDNGCKVEFDHPHTLLQDPEGYFTKMLEETGPAMTQTLKNVAKEAYESKYQTQNEED